LLTLGVVSDPIAFVAGNSQPASGSARAQTAPAKPLSANDVSWLFLRSTSLRREFRQSYAIPEFRHHPTTE
jgi:hypothetical protein